MKTQFGEMGIKIENDIITVKTEDDTLGSSDIEIAMQEYVDENYEGGKFDQNEVQRAEFFEDENIWAASIF